MKNFTGRNLRGSVNQIVKYVVVLLILFLGIRLNGVSQSFREKKTYIVNVNDNESSVTAEVLTKAKSLPHPDTDKEYYWFRANSIIATKGGYNGKLLHGQYSCFYLNNNLKEKGRYVLGLRHGKWIKWYDSGTIQEISQWKNGLKQGWVQTFNTRQELIEKSHYHKDRPHGEVITYDAGKITGKKKYRHGVEVIPKEKAVKKEKPLKLNPEAEKIKEIPAQKDTIQSKAPVKKAKSKKEPKEKK